MEKCYSSLNYATIWCASCWKNLTCYLVIVYQDGDFQKKKFCLIPMKISHKLCDRMDGTQFWCFPWFPANSLLCVMISILSLIFQHCAFVRYPSRFRSYALKANLAFSWRISAWLRRSTEIWGFWRLFREMFISMNSSRLMPPSPSLSFCAMVRSIHSRSENFKEFFKSHV